MDMDVSGRVEMQLGVSPSGRVHVAEDFEHGGKSSSAAEEIPFISKLKKAFGRSDGEGLFLLGAEKSVSGLSPSFVFWSDFASLYLRDLCQTPESERHDPPEVEVPFDSLSKLVDRAPPMEGGEYLDERMLADIWRRLDEYVRNRAASFNSGLTGFLDRYAPRWRGVGRVFFHLAENKRDPDAPFAFLATYAGGVSSTGRVQHQPLAKALTQYADAKSKKTLLRILAPVHEAAKSSALIRKLVESNEIYRPLTWTPRQAYQFLRESSRLEEAGVLVRLPDWWKKRARPQVRVSIGEKRKSSIGLDSMLDFKAAAVLGDHELTEQELRQLLDSEDGLVSLRGQWIEVDSEKLQETLDHWKDVQRSAVDGIDFLDGMRLLAGVPSDMSAPPDADIEGRASDWVKIEPGARLRELLEQLRDPESLAHADSDQSLRAVLRPYQEAGVHWLRLTTELGLGACLADDMGLGKTIQVLALLLAMKSKEASAGRPSLLVLPASLLSNWKAELERFAPTLEAAYVHLSLASKEELAGFAEDPDEAFQDKDIVMTTYSMLRRQSWIRETKWRLVVLDEAQAIKNPGSAQTRYVKSLKADARIALTGTPIENRLSDLWSLFDFLLPGLLGSRKRFQTFVKEIGKSEHPDFGPLRRLIAPYILRRLKTDRKIIQDLPEKTEVTAFCGLSKRQAVLYAATVREMTDVIDNADGIQRRGLVLSYLMRFKQLCNHPSQVSGDGEFSPKDSGKFARLTETCEEIAARQERVLVFTQFREMTAPLAEYLETVFGRPGLVLHGGTPVSRRKRLVDQFQSDDGPPFFVLSIKAGGTGLNLTAASHVVHFDRWWNPAVEDQATDRAFRIGQKKNVLVHKFVCQGTIEEKIDQLIREKRQLAGDVLQGGAEKMLTELNDTELLDLVSLNMDRVDM
jgi:SNF2 family DNA or RNA helicase